MEEKITKKRKNCENFCMLFIYSTLMNVCSSRKNIVLIIIPNKKKYKTNRNIETKEKIEIVDLSLFIPIISRKE
jgi:hypothetical protein